MPGKRRGATKEAAYRCLRGFSYPTLRSIRDRIRDGDHMPLEERGEWQRYVQGDKITNPPDDLIESWLKRGLVEPIGAAAKAVKSEEVSADDA